MTTNIVPLKAGNGIAAIIPQNIEEVFRLATAIAKSGLAPSTMKDPEKITVAIMHGLEIGLPPMQAIQKIAVINGRPSLWGDAVPALLWARGFKIIEGVVDGVATCTVVRPDGERITRTFSAADAKKAGLLGKPGPWQQFPDRMLQMRARAFAARDGAADALSGLYIAEELADSPEAVDITPKRKSSNAAKKDGETFPLFKEIEGKFDNAQTVEDLLTFADMYAQELADMPREWKRILDDTYEFRMQDLSAAEAEVIE